MVEVILAKKKENKAFHPNTIVLKVGETQNPMSPVTLQSRNEPQEWKVKTPKAAPILGL